MTKTSTRGKARRDRAQRTLPPDRDGDGKAGGSLKGNKTAPEALGTDDAALAQQEIAAGGLATIIIKAQAQVHQPRGHDIGVNGKLRKLAVGVEVKVNAEELAVLEASHIEYETLIPLPEADAGADGAEGSSPSATEEQPPVDPPVVEPDPPVVEVQPPVSAEGAGEGEAATKSEGEGAAS